MLADDIVAEIQFYICAGYTNICADVGKEELMVIAFVPEITEQVVESQIRSFGWRPEQWLAEEA